MLRPESWTEPAGVSPVRVGIGAPGSRPRSRGEIRGAERGVESLFGGNKRVGRSIEANPAASSKKQWGSRAVHVTVKAMSVRPGSGVSLAGSSGVEGAARTHGLVRNRRDPSVWPCRAKTTGISRW